MKPGKNSIVLIIFLFILNFSFSKAEDKIISVPLINLENLEPSFENVETEEDNNLNDKTFEIKNKNKNKSTSKSVIVNILGLDKITAKTTKISMKLGEKKTFGFLEIKAIKCGKSLSENEYGETAYLQIKDLTDKKNEKVFVFNGWTFSSSPTLKPIDHPVYDVWLVSCENV